MTATRSTKSPSRSPLQLLFGVVSDVRFIQIVGQIAFLILVYLAVSAVINEIFFQLNSRSLTPNFTFLQNRAGFDLANAPGYSPDDSFWDAYMVGLLNTITVVISGLISATLLGILAGILLLSTNWLFRNITRFIVEVLRNTPLLIVVVVAYFIVLGLPPQREAIGFPNEGITFIPLRWIIYIFAGLLVWRYQNSLPPSKHSQRRFFTWGTLAVIVLLELLIRQAPAASLGLFGAGIRLESQPIMYLSNRGLVYPQIQPTARFVGWSAFVLIGILAAIFVFVYFGRLRERTGETHPRILIGLLLIISLAVIGWMIVSAQPQTAGVPVQNADGTTTLMTLAEARAAELIAPEDEILYATEPLLVTVPVPQGLRYVGGYNLSQNFVAMFIALVIYTAAFIAEIVRAGILAVPKGQIEAARALGLSQSQMLQMVVLPQALRVIIPPLGNQYLNLAKNSSLAIAIAFSDVYAVMYTIINQSGQAVTGIVLLMITYLIISLIISAVMNWVNGRFQLKTR